VIKNVFFHQNNQFGLIKTCFAKFGNFGQMAGGGGGGGGGGGEAQRPVQVFELFFNNYFPGETDQHGCFDNL
jgi:hypothetical protein